MLQREKKKTHLTAYFAIFHRGNNFLAPWRKHLDALKRPTKGVFEMQILRPAPSFHRDRCNEKILGGERKRE